MHNCTIAVLSGFILSLDDVFCYPLLFLVRKYPKLLIVAIERTSSIDQQTVIVNK